MEISLSSLYTVIVVEVSLLSFSSMWLSTSEDIIILLFHFAGHARDEKLL